MQLQLQRAVRVVEEEVPGAVAEEGVAAAAGVWVVMAELFPLPSPPRPGLLVLGPCDTPAHSLVDLGPFPRPHPA